jgi:ABC-type branched-subunit amino acid transport system ATPase component
MITIESVSRTYGDFTAVDDVSFTAQPGRVTGFLGPNGAGKSTTMRIIVGLTQPTSGTATVAGRRYVDLPNPGLVRIARDRAWDLTAVALQLTDSGAEKTGLCCLVRDERLDVRSEVLASRTREADDRLESPHGFADGLLLLHRVCIQRIESALTPKQHQVKLSHQ